MSNQTCCFSCYGRGKYTVIEQTCMSCLGCGHIIVFGGTKICDQCLGKGTVTVIQYTPCYQCNGSGTMAY